MSNEVLENIKSRRSVRTYTEQQVSAGDLNLILEAAAYAPSGMYGAQNETYIEGWEKKASNLLIYKRLCKI